MKKDVFSSWFKELCSLVFVQAFQAFLLAIIMSMIVKIMASTVMSQDGALDATGFLAIIALSSLSKIELLLKNIFGLTSGQGDPTLAAGRRSFMGSVLALRGAKRVLDNGRKFVGGLGKGIGGTVRTIGARRNYYEAVADKKNSELPKDKGDDRDTDKFNKYNSYQIGGGLHNSGGDISRLSDELAELTSAIKTQNKNQDKNSKDDKLDKLKAAIDSAKADRNEGFKTALSGAAETVGALHGATVGAVVGLSRGEDIGTSILTGAGAGDTVGEGIANAATNITINAPKAIKTGAHEIARTKNISAYSQIARDLKKENNKKIKDIKEVLKTYNKSNNPHDKNVDDV